MCNFQRDHRVFLTKFLQTTVYYIYLYRKSYDVLILLNSSETFIHRLLKLHPIVDCVCRSFVGILYKLRIMMEKKVNDHNFILFFQFRIFFLWIINDILVFIEFINQNKFFLK